MPRKSAGLLIYRTINSAPEVLLVHPGGPFWRNKDLQAWSIPKGEFTDEDPLKAAIRETMEETGYIANPPFLPLTVAKQKSGKLVYAWACAGDFDPGQLVSNSFPLEWPPSSGKTSDFPEVDKAGWFIIREAKEKINPGQVPFLDELREILGRS